MFWAGGVPAIARALYSRTGAGVGSMEAEARATTRAILNVVRAHWASAIYLVLMMTLMMFLSHGTQDLYPDFLKSTHGAKPKTVAYIAIWFKPRCGARIHHLRASIGYRGTKAQHDCGTHTCRC
jgi:SHS family lactate transporter-like MFS transporter